MSEYHDLVRWRDGVVREFDRLVREMRERCPHAETHWLADHDYVWLVCRNCLAQLRRGRPRRDVEYYPVVDPEGAAGE